MHLGKISFLWLFINRSKQLEFLNVSTFIKFKKKGRSSIFVELLKEQNKKYVVVNSEIKYLRICKQISRSFQIMLIAVMSKIPFLSLCKRSQKIPPRN